VKSQSVGCIVMRTEMNMMCWSPLRSRVDEKLQMILMCEAVGKKIYSVDVPVDEHK
jgi:hypothetical protein